MTHKLLVSKAVEWLRCEYRCGIVLSEQYCQTGETPDAIGWKGKCHSVVVECKISRCDFLADLKKPWRINSDEALGCERFYLVPRGLICLQELPKHWGLLEYKSREICVALQSAKKLRTAAGLLNEMNLLLASLRRVEVRIEPQTITDFLKWKNRLAEYNGGMFPSELLRPEQERNPHLD